jgi:hypothetical protein
LCCVTLDTLVRACDCESSEANASHSRGATRVDHIEKSGFRRGEYVGYVAGRVFKVTRVTQGKRTIGWEARAALGSHIQGRCNYTLAPSLAGLDRALAELA